jgi:gamma-glutamyltranspeptidase/glutathione hydrolase
MRRISLVLGLLLAVSLPAKTPAPKPGQNAIASAHYLATEAGHEIFARGGNAFDAAVAVSATLSVVEPISSGLGGGGFFLLHDSKSGKDHFIDARNRARCRDSSAVS